MGREGSAVELVSDVEASVWLSAHPEHRPDPVGAAEPADDPT